MRIGHHFLSRSVQYFRCRGKAAVRTKRGGQLFADGVEHGGSVRTKDNQRRYTAAMQLRCCSDAKTDHTITNKQNYWPGPGGTNTAGEGEGARPPSIADRLPLDPHAAGAGTNPTDDAELCGRPSPLAPRVSTYRARTDVLALGIANRLLPLGGGGPVAPGGPPGGACPRPLPGREGGPLGGGGGGACCCGAASCSLPRSSHRPEASS